MPNKKNPAPKVTKVNNQAPAAEKKTTAAPDKSKQVEKLIVLNNNGVFHYCTESEFNSAKKALGEKYTFVEVGQVDTESQALELINTLK